MKNATKSLFLVLFVGLLGSGCHMARSLSVSHQMNIHNDITARGFRYIKKGVEARHMIKGIWPAHSRSKLCANLNIPQLAYSKLWEAAGGIKDNQRLVNVVVEASIVAKSGFGIESFVVVHMYADVIEFDAAGGGGTAKRFGTPKAAKRRTMALIQRAVQRVVKRQG